MTISINQVNNVLKAYRKQNKPLNPMGFNAETTRTQTDTVTLSSEADKAETTDKITYSLLDVLLKNRKPES